MFSHKKRGFTLIELLVVIAIVGVLSAIIIGSVGSGRAKARDAKRFAELKQLQSALELYFQAHGCHPRGVNTIGDVNRSTVSNPCPGGPLANSLIIGSACTGAGSVNDHFNNSLQVLVDTGLIKSLPQDPLNVTSAGVNYCYNYARVEPATSSWTCGGVQRTKYAYSISFSTETSTFNLPVNNQSTYDYCILGARVYP